MLKNILNLEGARKLTKSEQKLISAGEWRYSEATGYCVYPLPVCSGALYSKQYPGNWCCEK
ncbi:MULTISPECIES: hypothetical protein [Flavobacterium]|jgi:hypothetical protein|uniref:Uncharacterized protein n=1 Tax=Flavobacterium hydatis TaxID=991 RepID=A0A086AI31_FLAHY|nr:MULTISPECIES: hypothetical protein [Flavobacterium]KIC03740.1 hypothetical protein OA88_01165 [Flavobacterium sp. JRM]KFF16345.1 hypothetical protein IW20_11335 [Flavobacterium hydatis]MEA9413930.1 hypothetical protein [Flavobacterium sp. PL02]OUL59914.1 hypothetical protein B8T70_23090 [Flavobacterium sp. AJR]OXA96638.1 hypothetical protein B0A62_05085 [Flavobacterium hydatis]